jgi:PRTRC genetic system protein B
MENPFVPTCVITVYTSKKEYDNFHHYYIEIQNVQVVNKTNVLSAGVPLSQSALSDLLGVVDNENNKELYFNYGLLNKYLLACEPVKYKRFILWYSKPGKYKMNFSDSMPYKDGEYTLPAFLYFVTNNSLQVYALKSNKRPTLKTKLYRAPIFNITNGKHLCMGNIKNNSDNIMNIDEEMKYWEQVLWNSTFTNHAAPKLNKPIKEVYKLSLNGHFSSEVLIDTEMTINSLLSSIK